MRRSRWLLVVLFVVLSSVLAWACGGDEEDEPGATTAPATTSPAEGTAPAAETPEAGRTPQAQGDVGEFADLVGKFEKATFKATYQVSSSGTEQGFEGTLVYYKKGENLRMDVESEIAGEQSSAILISLPDKSYFCSEIPELGEGATCFETPAEVGTGIGETISGLYEELSNPDVEILSTEGREVAGQELDCFIVRSPEFEGESEVCTNEIGAPLATKVTSGSEVITMEAIAFSVEVSDEDFEPPYPISEGIPGLPNEP
jgi:hypothetical protein